MMAVPGLAMGQNPVALPGPAMAAEGQLEAPGEQASNDSFFDALENALAETNQLQLQAGDVINQTAAGLMDDPVALVTAMEKAQLSLELTVQVRNKAIEAYQEMMRLQV